MTDYVDLLERLARKVRVRPVMGGGTVSAGGAKPTSYIEGMGHANPDGPEAIAVIKALQAENARLREAAQQLRQQISIKDRVLHDKNVALDALGWVWCDGGCKAGVGRFTEFEPTEEAVVIIEHNTKRLRRWFTNRAYRARQALATD